MIGIDKLNHWCNRSPARKVSFTYLGNKWRCDATISDKPIAVQVGDTKDEAANMAVGVLRLRGF